jgi:hypothetical protein
VKIEQPSTPLPLLQVTKCGNDAERRTWTLHHHNTDIRSLSPAAAGPAVHFDPAGTNINSLTKTDLDRVNAAGLSFVLSLSITIIFLFITLMEWGQEI